MEAIPVARGAPRPAVNNQFLGLFGHFGVEVVHQHAQRRFLLPALAGNLLPPRRTHRPLGQSRVRHRS